jgi:hypothetical protein
MMENFKKWLELKESGTSAGSVAGHSGTDSGDIAGYKRVAIGGKSSADLNQFTKCGLGGCPKPEKPAKKYQR